MTISLLLLLEKLDFSVLLLLKLFLFLFLTDICLEVFELLLCCSLTFIIVHGRFWKGFDRSVSDGDKHLFLFFGFLFSFSNFLSFGLNLSFESSKISFIFDNNLIFHSVSISFFISWSILSWEQKSSSYEGFCWNLWCNDFVAFLRHLKIYKLFKAIKKYKIIMIN